MCGSYVVVLKNDGSVYSMGWKIASEWPEAGASIMLPTLHTDGRMWGHRSEQQLSVRHDRKGLSYHNPVGSGTVAYPVLSGLSVLPGPRSPLSPPALSPTCPRTPTTTRARSGRQRKGSLMRLATASSPPIGPVRRRRFWLSSGGPRANPRLGERT